jgi:hypothetical protein
MAQAQRPLPDFNQIKADQKGRLRTRKIYGGQIHGVRQSILKSKLARS